MLGPEAGLPERRANPEHYQTAFKLCPGTELGQEAIWSGCCLINGDGQPMAPSLHADGGAAGLKPFQAWPMRAIWQSFALQ
jgi:hypothetical protein